MNDQFYYGKNTEFLESPVNVCFEEVLAMSLDEFKQWARDLRKVVVDLWDNKGLPPRVGLTVEEMIKQFNDLESMVSKKLLTKDDLTGKLDVINNTFNLGNAVNQFFPTMMKTRINYTNNVDAGYSIYDYFAKEELFDSFVTYGLRNFKRDSFYNYSIPAREADSTVTHIPFAKSGVEWINKFEEENYRKKKKVEYWLCPITKNEAYSGYNEALRSIKKLRLSRQEIESLWNVVPDRCKTNIDWKRSEIYEIRHFKLGQKLFPIGLKAFRVTFSQYAVNFPPPVAKYIYDQYTKEWKDDEEVYVWDPSSGWGGRLMGALSSNSPSHLIYLGNDPNTDHNTTPGRTKYHEVYDFYCNNVKKGWVFDNVPHTGFKFWQKGSEVMQYEPEFQQYKGKLSLAFTSPPYWAKEAYSEDAEQSYRKFSEYESWKKGFLEETLKTAVEWLRPGGYLLWNVSDTEFSNKRMPLETDSREILLGLGMEYIETLKMTLAQAPGGKRIDPITGKPNFKNSCKVGGMWRKFEPIAVFRKPK